MTSESESKLENDSGGKTITHIERSKSKLSRASLRSAT